MVSPLVDFQVLEGRLRQRHKLPGLMLKALPTKTEPILNEWGLIFKFFHTPKEISRITSWFQFLHMTKNTDFTKLVQKSN